MTTQEFINSKLADAEKTLKLREQMEKAWREGTDATWAAVGCFDSKADRLKMSEAHGRIAVKNREEVKMFEAVLEQLKK